MDATDAINLEILAILCRFESHQMQKEFLRGSAPPLLTRKPVLVVGVGRWTTWNHGCCMDGKDEIQNGHASRAWECRLDHRADAFFLPNNVVLPQNLFMLSNPTLKHLHDNAWKDLLEGTHSFICLTWILHFDWA